MCDGACPRVACSAFVPSYRKKYYRKKVGVSREDKIYAALNELKDMVLSLEEEVKKRSQ